MEEYNSPAAVQDEDLSPAHQAAQEFGEDNAGRAAVVDMARLSDDKKEEVPAQTKMDALDWFLSDDPDEGVATKVIALNVATKPGEERWIEWTIQAMQRERIQTIRDQVRKRGRRARRGDETDEAQSNLRIATEGTVYPDLRDPKVRGEFLDPSDALKHRFRNKPGLIDQIAGEVIGISGYDDDDVREVDAVKT